MAKYLCQDAPYTGWAVYGPYQQAEGRLIVNLVRRGERKSVSYPKLIMEIHMGRCLDPVMETVDHIDRNFYNNTLSNLRVVSRAQNSREDACRLVLPSLECALCGNTVPEPRVKQAYRNTQRPGPRSAGPFCSRSCAGKYGKAVQMKKTAPLPPVAIKARFTKTKKKPAG